MSREDGDERAYRTELVRENAGLQVKLAEAQAEVARLTADLAECYRLSGFDHGGNDYNWLAKNAVSAVRELRIESDEKGELEAEVARLRAALKFYADERRYRGPNQPAFDGDEFTTDAGPYMVDVSRDWGRIARAALEPTR